MVRGFGAQCAKYFLFVVNVLFFLAGALLLAIGLWLRFDARIGAYLSTNGTLEQLLGLAAVMQRAYAVFIAFGTFVFVAGFCGCFGAIHESRWLLGVYIGLVVAAVVGELGGGVYAVVKFNSIEESVDNAMRADLRENYARNASLISDDRMAELDCCGWIDYRDFSTYVGIALPKVCCFNASYATCASEALRDQPDHIYGGCKTLFVGMLINVLQTFGRVFIGVAVAIALLEIVVLVAAIGLCCTVKH